MYPARRVRDGDDNAGSLMGKRNKINGYWLFVLDCKYFIEQRLSDADGLILNYVRSNIWPLLPDAVRQDYKEKAVELTRSNERHKAPLFLSRADFELMLHLRDLMHIYAM